MLFLRHGHGRIFYVFFLSPSHSIETKFSFQKDVELEQKVLQWIISVVDEKPKTDYDKFIQDGSILGKLMTRIVLNSVPLDQVDGDNWGAVSFLVLMNYTRKT